MRHGEKGQKTDPQGEDYLTGRGKKQVAASATKYLADITFIEVYVSGLYRALETAGIALAITSHPEMEIITESGLDYRWCLNARQVPVHSLAEAEKRLAEEGVANPTVYDWLRAWPPALGMRQMMLATIQRLSHEADKEYSSDVSILMAGHSPVLETAVPNPREFPRLREADICVYTVDVMNCQVNIESASYLPCPSVA